jgi:hypothetical protein
MSGQRKKFRGLDQVISGSDRGSHPVRHRMWCIQPKAAADLFITQMMSWSSCRSTNIDSRIPDEWPPPKRTRMRGHSPGQV